MRSSSMAAVAVMLAAACGGGGKKSPDTAAAANAPSCTAESRPTHDAVGSCMVHQAAGDYCAEYTGSNDADKNTELCSKYLKGAYAAGPCKKEGAVARCLVQCGKPGEGVNTYYFGVADTWKNSCATTKGTFLEITP